MIPLDVTHLIVAAVALLGPVVLKRLQALAVPPPAAPQPPPDVTSLLPLHGLLLRLAVELLQRQAANSPQQPSK